MEGIVRVDIEERYTIESMKEDRNTSKAEISSIEFFEIKSTVCSEGLCPILIYPKTGKNNYSWNPVKKIPKSRRGSYRRQKWAVKKLNRIWCIEPRNITWKIKLRWFTEMSYSVTQESVEEKSNTWEVPFKYISMEGETEVF